MPKSVLKWILKLRYHIDYQGFDEPVKGPALLIVEGCSSLDPVFAALGWSRGVTALLTKRAAKEIPRWLRGILKVFLLPLYFVRLPAFSNQRLQERLNHFHSTGDVLILNSHNREELLAPLVKRVPRAIYFVEVEGMRGSHLSTYPSKEAQKVQTSFWDYFWIVVKNGLFFVPKRKVTVVFTPASSEIELTAQSIGQWFTHRRRDKAYPVPYYFWKKEGEAPRVVDDIVFKELRRLSNHEEINEEMDLYEDLGLDSLDVTELLVFLEKEFHESTHFDELRAVKDVVNAAQGVHRHVPPFSEIQEQQKKGWISERPPLAFAEGESIPEVFLRSVDRMGSAAAVVDPQGVLSYTRLKTVVMGLVEFFENLPGKNVGVMLPPLSNTMAVILALMIAKKVPALLNWTLGNRHLEEVIEGAQIEAVITAAPLIQSLGYQLSDQLVRKIVLIEEIKNEITTAHRARGILQTRKSTEELLKEMGPIDPDSVAVLLFTSGTEKSPKGVPLTHRNLLSNQKSAVQSLDLNKTDVILGILPSFHVFGFSLTQLMPILIGCRTIFNPALLDLATVSRLIHEYGASIVCSVPTFLQALLALNKSAELASVRHFIVGAEKTPPSLRSALQGKLVEGYGLTECSPLVTLNRTGESTQGVGAPIDGVEVRVLHPETHTPCSGQGVIAIAGDNVFKGYTNAPAPFIELEGKQWFVTGDLGEMQEGVLLLQGRLSRTIKKGGELISLPAIEQSLLEAFPDSSLAVIALEERLILCSNSFLSIERVNDALRGQGWSNLVKIESVQLLERLPLSSTGKVDYRALQSMVKTAVGKTHPN